MNVTWCSETTTAAGAARGAPARFDQAPARSCAGNRAAQATYLPAGYPNQAQSQRILHHLAEVTDVIELGWPHQSSDRPGDWIAGDLR